MNVLRYKRRNLMLHIDEFDFMYVETERIYASKKCVDVLP